MRCKIVMCFYILYSALSIFYKNVSGYFCLVVISLVLFSCKNDSVPKEKIDPTIFKEALVKVNKYEVQKETDEIEQYIKHRNWKMTVTKTGLRYMIMKTGKGENPLSGQTVKMNYKISLLDGTECYSSEKENAKEFIVDNDNVESGIHEAVQLMHTGEKAKFILPSKLAHGLHGDDNKIPPLSAIIVDLELLEIK
ncbi:MAG: FKBP-type peptidyl-prolyl cis-trans isomerase [Bacteroidota bacterium]